MSVQSIALSPGLAQVDGYSLNYGRSTLMGSAQVRPIKASIGDAGVGAMHHFDGFDGISLISDWSHMKSWCLTIQSTWRLTEQSDCSWHLADTPQGLPTKSAMAIRCGKRAFAATSTEVCLADKAVTGKMAAVTNRLVGVVSFGASTARAVIGDWRVVDRCVPRYLVCH